jgi:hypothetical protein
MQDIFSDVLFIIIGMVLVIPIYPVVFKFLDFIEWFPFRRQFIFYEDFEKDHDLWQEYWECVTVKEILKYSKLLPEEENLLFEKLSKSQRRYCIYMNIHPSNFLKNTINKIEP